MVDASNVTGVCATPLMYGRDDVAGDRAVVARGRRPGHGGTGDPGGGRRRRGRARLVGVGVAGRPGDAERDHGHVDRGRDAATEGIEEMLIGAVAVHGEAARRGTRRARQQDHRGSGLLLAGGADVDHGGGRDVAAGDRDGVPARDRPRRRAEGDARRGRGHRARGRAAGARRGCRRRRTRSRSSWTGSSTRSPRTR